MIFVKIALFGGSFDPVHFGHLNAAKEVLLQRIVQSVWFIPVQNHAFKESGGMAGFGHRKRMVELAIRGCSGLKAIDLNENPTYTIDTILKAKKLFPSNRYFWLMGTNLVKEFSSWKQPESILREAKLILFSVPGSERCKSTLVDSSSPIRVNAKAIDLSSTKVREMLSKGQRPQGIVSNRVLDYIKKHGLYK